MTMVEKVAAAMFGSVSERVTPGVPWSADERILWMETARAAIEAMREPTDEVRQIMAAHASNGYVNWDDYHEAMIDAALRT